MKSPILLLAYLVFASSLMAQVPQEFRLQGLARDNGQILTNSSIDLRVTISAGGSLVFQEVHTVMTDGFGQFGIDVGDGAPLSGSFLSIPWESAQIDYDIELDTGNGFVSIGTDLFRSVPYALTARTVTDVTLAGLNDVDTTGLQIGQVMKWDGSSWVPMPDASTDGDSDPTNEWQTLSLNGNVLSISSPLGNSITLPTGGTSYAAGNGIDITGSVISNTGDLDPSDDVIVTDLAGGDVSGVFSNLSVNGIQGQPISATTPTAGQVLAWDGIQWVAASDGDQDATNELQSMVLVGNQLSLSGGGGTVTLPQYTGGPGINISGTTITNTGDLNANDDLIVGSSAGGDLGGTYPSPVVAAINGTPVSNITPSSGQTLVFSGGQWTPQTIPASLFTENVDTAIYQGGSIQLQTSSGATRAELGIDASNNGYIRIYDNTNTLKAGIQITAGQGEVFGDAKNFRMDHPEDPDKEIWYASLEGPEAAAYVRGTCTLEHGMAEVNFPDHFQLVANSESMTVMLTPLSGQSKGLAVVEKTNTGFRVVELLGGTGNYSFDWEVKCVRNGFEDYQVLREKSVSENGQHSGIEHLESGDETREE